MPDAKITDNDCFYKIEREGLLRFDITSPIGSDAITQFTISWST